MSEFAPKTPAHHPACQDCGTRLVADTCPACALSSLLGTPAPEPLPEFGRYLLRSRRASGGMGVVYVAEDKKLRRTVALKMIRGSTFANEAELARFTIETEAAAALDHPHIVPIYEVGQHDGQPFFTMKLIEGESLAERLASPRANIPEREAAALLSKVARAVHHAHQHGVLHRDLKPGNILIDTSGTPWLTDFGLAKIAHAESGLTLTTDHIGTPDYMSPEIAGGNAREASTASDIWALGVILWEMLFGVPPFRGSGTVETMRRILETEPARMRGLKASPDLVTLALRCLEKKPSRRLASAAELAAELDRWLGGKPIRARPVTRGERLLKWVRRNPAWAALYVALASGACATLVFWQRAESAVVSLTGANEDLARALGIATATKLAVEARTQVGEDPARALLLAVEAVDLGEMHDGSVLPKTAESLTDVLQKVGGFDVSPLGPRVGDQADGFIGVGYAKDMPASISPDGRWMFAIDSLLWDERGVIAAVFDLHDENPDGPVVRWKLWERFEGALKYCWHPDSERILSVGADGEVRLWEPLAPAPEGTLVDRDPPSRAVGNVSREGLNISRILAPDASQGSAWIAVIYTSAEEGSDILDQDAYVAWFGTGADGSLQDANNVDLHPLPAGAGSLHTVTISPDRRWLLAKRSQNTDAAYLIRVGPHGHLQERSELPEGSFMLEGSTFSQDGNWLAFRKPGSGARVYDLRSGHPQIAAASTGEAATELAAKRYFSFSPDGRWLAVVGDSPKVLIVPLDPASDGSPIWLHLPGDENFAVCFSPDGRWLAAGGIDRTVTVWPMEDIASAPQPVIFRGVRSPVVDIAFSPDGRTLVATGLHCSHRRWPIVAENSGALPKVLPGARDTIADLALSQDGNWIVSACRGLSSQPEAGVVKIANVHGGGEHVLGYHAHAATGVAISQDGKWLASTGLDGRANVWMFAEVVQAIKMGEAIPDPLHVFDMRDTRLHFDRKLAFHPRGTLYCTCGDGVLFAWDLNAPDPPESRSAYEIHSIRYLLPNLAISPDARLLAVCRHGWDSEPKEGTDQKGNMVLLFDVSEPGPPVLLSTLPASFLDNTGIDFSADGRWLAAGGSGFGTTVWDLKAPDIHQSARTSAFSSHRNAGVAFSPDGQWLALGGSDGRIHLWDWKGSGEVRTTLVSTEVSALAWIGPDSLVSGGKSGRIAIWQTEIDRLKNLARTVAGRDLSPEERERFRIPDRE